MSPNPEQILQLIRLNLGTAFPWQRRRWVPLRDAAGSTSSNPAQLQNFLPFAKRSPRNFSLHIKSDLETNCCKLGGERRGGHHHLVELRKKGKSCNLTPKWHRCCYDRHNNALPAGEATGLSLEFPSWAGHGAGPSTPSPELNPSQDLSPLTLPLHFFPHGQFAA